jgi:hypothetical protein
MSFSLRKLLRSRWLLPAAVLVTTLLLGACTRDLRWTINPDRSGKITFVMRLPSLKEMAKKIGPIIGNPSAEVNTEEGAIEALRQFTRGMAGIEVWGDPIITDNKDFTTIGITGYFPDVNKINFTGPLPGDPNSTLFPNTSRLSEDGKLWILTLSDPSAENSASVRSPGPTVPEVEADDLRREIYETKALFEILMPSLAEAAKELPSDMGDREEIIPGGRIVKAEGCETDGTKAWTFESLRDALQRASKLVRDDEVILLLVREAKRQKVGIWNIDWGKASADSRELRRTLARKYAPSRLTPVRVTVIPGEPVFNYSKEVTAARNSPNALMQRIRDNAKSTD